MGPVGRGVFGVGAWSVDGVPGCGHLQRVQCHLRRGLPHRRRSAAYQDGNFAIGSEQAPLAHWATALITWRTSTLSRKAGNTRC